MKTLKEIHENKRLQLLLGGLIGVAFGFLLQRGQVTRYEVIMAQLLLQDFTVLKIILTAVITGMAGVYLLNRAGLVEYNIKAGSAGASAFGGLVFGTGMALLGYCPGTNAGAVGQGSLDALLGGTPGIIAGSVIYGMIYPMLERRVLHMGSFGKMTLDEVLNTRRTNAMAGVYMVAVTLFFLLELAGR
jgi:hypothetical protein